MKRIHTRRNDQNCTICKVYFDNWLATHDYDEDHERRVRANFCRYCRCCDSCRSRKN